MAIRPQGSQQLPLFDKSQYGQPTAPNPDQWMKQNEGDVVYHGSFRESGDWADAPVVHAGTLGQASHRIDAVRSRLSTDQFARVQYKDPSLSEESWHDMDLDPSEWGADEMEGRVFARRLTEKPAPGTFSDAEANAGEFGSRLKSEESWDIPGSIGESAGPLAPSDSGEGPDWKHASSGEAGEVGRARLAEKHLDDRRPIRYSNHIEGSNPHDRVPLGGTPHPLLHRSIATSPINLRSWEKDTLANPQASKMQQDYANQRIQQGREGAVPFPVTAGKHSGGAEYGFPKDVMGQANYRGVKQITYPRKNISSMQFGGDDVGFVPKP